MALTQFAIQSAKPLDRPYKLSDGGGLHLLIQPNGSKLWRFRYRFAGKENMLAVGIFPRVSLSGARQKRDEAQRLLAQGVDPSQKRKEDKVAASISAANTFGVIAKEYQVKLKEEGRSESTLVKIKWQLEDLASPLTDRPIAQIKSAEILQILQRIEKSGRKDTARRLRGTVGSVFRLAIATLRAENDPTYALRGALSRPNVKHRAAVTDERELGALAQSIDEYDGWPTLKAALQVLLLTMARPGEVRLMRKPELELKKAVWRIPPERTKMRRPHDVPLSKQAVAVLKDISEVSGSDLVFPSIRSNRKPLSENAMNSALRRMGYTKDEVTAHGFRASASTILNERGFNPDVIEAALGHQDEDEVRRAYNRAKYWPERVALLQTWADLLDEFRQPVRKAA
ncbi:MAG: tyrosine-type recombinase/integrase [Enhydrobacter sp.]|nr:MAG: tyrosine-type recombinase/integrase [Enhydrobacter sp.]